MTTLNIRVESGVYSRGSTPKEYVQKEAGSVLSYYRINLVVAAIISPVGTLVAVYLSGKLASYLASAAGQSPLIIPSWMSNSALIGLPILVGTLFLVEMKDHLDRIYEAARDNIGVGHLQRHDVSFIDMFHSHFTQQFYTPAGADRERDGIYVTVIKGDLPSHVAISTRDISTLRQLLELAQQTLKKEELITYFNHRNARGESVWTIAENNGTLTSLKKILSDLGLSDLAPDEDL